jgi:hypothetical protein
MFCVLAISPLIYGYVIFAFFIGLDPLTAISLSIIDSILTVVALFPTAILLSVGYIIK